MTKKQKRMKAMVESMQEFWNTYSQQSEYLNYSAQTESDAMAAFLASRSGNISLEERARLWSIEVERIQKQMQEKVKQGAGNGES